MDADLDTLATALYVTLYVTIDDLLKTAPHLAPWRPTVGITPKLSDAELVTLAVMQALLGFTSEARWLRHAHAHLRHLFPYLPKQPSYNKRLRAAADLLRRIVGVLARDTTLWTDDVWVGDSTPVECGRSTQTVGRLRAGRLGPGRLLRQPLPLLLGAAAAPGLHAARPAGRLRADRRQGRRAPDPARHAGRRPEPAGRPGHPDLIADKNSFARPVRDRTGRAWRATAASRRKGERARAGAHLLHLFKPLRQVIESINNTFKAQLDLERHHGHTPTGVAVRVLQRILALPAVIWHNDHTGQPTARSLIAYDHCDDPRGGRGKDLTRNPTGLCPGFDLSTRAAATVLFVARSWSGPDSGSHRPGARCTIRRPKPRPRRPRALPTLGLTRTRTGLMPAVRSVDSASRPHEQHRPDTA